MKRRKHVLHKLVVIVTICFISYHLLSRMIFKISSTHVGWRDSDFNPNLKFVNNEVVVLRWTPFFRDYDKSPEILTSESCPYVEVANKQWGKFGSCRITFDRRYLKVSDALVFHSFDLMWEEVPKERIQGQIWVYQQLECPIYTKLNLQEVSDVFNWTMTYRRDSDVYHPYGHISPLPKPNHANLATNLRNKTGQVAWIVSSCHSYSKREHLVQELQKYISVDVYGWCGNKCPNESDCYGWISKKYKFYLSFENSLCSDYITEKFFTAMKHDIVPVVYGGSSSEDYSYIAPAGSYIDTRDFKSAKDLATYLLYLDKNKTEYLKYFEWKLKHKVLSSQGWCNLCQKVYENFQAVPQKRYNKWYKDLWKWWNYMGYDTSVEVNANSIHLGVERGQSYYYKLGSPVCHSAREFTSGNKENPDFEPGFINGRIYGKLWEWAVG